jgi:hypothetical protein
VFNGLEILIKELGLLQKDRIRLMQVITDAYMKQDAINKSED